MNTFMLFLRSGMYICLHIRLMRACYMNEYYSVQELHSVELQFGIFATCHDHRKLNATRYSLYEILRNLKLKMNK